jgi:plasmid maintenance system antidote protein VapI
MDNAAKSKIKQQLISYCTSYQSHAKAAKSLKDVSPAMISLIVNDKWENIADRMWLNISKQISIGKENWFNAETHNYRLLTQLLADAKDNSRVHAIIGGAGWGKDTAAKPFASANEHVYLIDCNEFFNKKYFMVELLRKMGLQVAGTVPEMMERAVRHLNRTLRPLIILNEVDKLKDETLYFFITLYNLCEDKCGIVIWQQINWRNALHVAYSSTNADTRRYFPE